LFEQFELLLIIFFSVLDILINNIKENATRTRLRFVHQNDLSLVLIEKYFKQVDISNTQRKK